MKSFTSLGQALTLAFFSLTSGAAAASIPPTYTNGASSSNFSMPINGTNATAVGASGTVPSDVPTLLPAVHWMYPVDDIRNLAPINTTDLYYSAEGVSDPNVKHLFASMSTTLRYEAVVLDHSSFVKDVSCASDGIHVDFKTPEAFRFAANAWPHPTDFVLVTYTDGCGASSTQRTFWLIDDIRPQNGTNTILAVVRQELAIEDALGDVELVWGTYHPPGSNSTDNSTANGSSGATNGNSCGPAPAGTVDGFPAADCGAAGFDRQLDNALGYQSLGNGSMGSFIPNVPKSGNDNRRRGFGSWISSIGHKISSGVQKVGNTIGSAVKSGAQKVASAGKSIISDITNPHITKSADISVQAPAFGGGPWKDGFLIFKDSASKGNVSGTVSVYCVDCGVKGHVTVTGSAKWGIIHGLEQLNTQIQANIEAGVSLGIDATAAYTKTESKNLITQAIPDLGFSVDKVFAAGVFVSVDATATLDIDAEAQILAGVTMKLPNLNANLNIKDADSGKQSTVTGATPEWDHTFSAKGSVTASAILALPISLQLGVKIIPLKFDKSVSLVEKPNLTGKITLAGSVGDGGPASKTCNDGLDYSITAGNDIDLDLFGLTTISLEHYVSPPLVTGCQKIPGLGPKTTTSAHSSVATLHTKTTSGDKTGTASKETGTASKKTDAASKETGTATHHVSASPTHSVNGTSHTHTTHHSEATHSHSHYGNGTVHTHTRTHIGSDIHTTPAAATTDKNPATKSKQDTCTDDKATSTTSKAAASTPAYATPAYGSTGASPTGVQQSVNSTTTSQGVNSTNPDGINYVTITEIHETFILVPGEDGNLYTGTSSSNTSSSSTAVWASFDEVIVGDNTERFLYFYPEVMQAFNVSRIRLGAQDTIPQGAQVVALVQDETVQGAHYAATTTGESFGLVKCDFSNGASSKVFIASDENGPDTLKQDKLRYTVTGAAVEDCQWLALLAGGI